MMTRLQLNYQTLDANSSWARDWDQDSLVSSTSGDSHVLAYFSGINVNRAGTAVRPQYGPESSQSAQTANGNGFLIECTIKCEMHFTAQKQTTSKEEKTKAQHTHTHTHIHLLQIANSKWSLAPVLKRTRSYIAHIYRIYIFYICFLLQLSEIVAIEMKLAVRHYCKLSSAPERLYSIPVPSPL